MKISKKQIEYAIEALRANNIITNDNQYPKVFKGYISSFGAAVIQSGHPEHDSRLIQFSVV